MTIDRSNSIWSLGSWSPTLTLKRHRKSWSASHKQDHQRCSEEINKTDSSGRNLLFYCAEYDQPEVAMQLLTSGCDPAMPDVNGNTSLHVAISKGNKEVTDVFLKHSRVCVNSVNNIGETPLMLAVQNDDVETTKLLLKAGAKMNEMDVLGRNALLLGLISGAEHSCRCLLKAGCNVNQVDKNGHSALFYATNTKVLTSLDCAKKLMKSGYKAKKDVDWLLGESENEASLLATDNKFHRQILSKAGIKKNEISRMLSGHYISSSVPKAHTW